MRHWSEGEHVVAYHGTHEDNVDNILHNGVSHKDPNTGKVSVAIGSNGEEVASAYACMSGAGGEHKFRQPGANVVSVPPHKRVVVVMHIPRAWADQHVDQSHGGNSDHIKAILRNPALFHKNVATTGKDWKRTEPVELRFGEAIPAKYIVGTKVKGQQMKPVEKANEERMMTFKEFSESVADDGLSDGERALHSAFVDSGKTKIPRRSASFAIKIKMGSHHAGVTSDVMQDIMLRNINRKLGKNLSYIEDHYEEVAANSMTAQGSGEAGSESSGIAPKNNKKLFGAETPFSRKRKDQLRRDGVGH